MEINSFSFKKMTPASLTAQWTCMPQIPSSPKRKKGVRNVSHVRSPSLTRSRPSGNTRPPPPKPSQPPHPPTHTVHPSSLPLLPGRSPHGEKSSVRSLGEFRFLRSPSAGLCPPLLFKSLTGHILQPPPPPGEEEELAGRSRLPIRRHAVRTVPRPCSHPASSAAAYCAVVGRRSQSGRPPDSTSPTARRGEAAWGGCFASTHPSYKTPVFPLENPILPLATCRAFRAGRAVY